METGVRSAREVAEALRLAVIAERRAEAAKLALVCELADVYRSVVPVLERPGGPRLVPAGADGTVEVDDFLVEELHPLLGVGPAAAWSLLRQATNLRDRHPRVWGLVQAGAVPAWQGRQVAELCRHLGWETAAAVDVRIAAALGRLAWPRARRRLVGLIAAVDTEAAAERVAQARRDRFVRIEHTDDGTSWLTARLKTADAVLLAEAVGAIARSILAEPGYPGSLDEARADAVGVLVTPTRPGAGLVRPGAATLVVHLDRADVTQPDSIAAVGRVQGGGGLDAIGPVLLDQVRELVAHRRVRVLPVIDLADDPAVDAYEIPERLQTQVDLRDGFSVFPFATAAARGCDHDHTVPWRAGGPPGQTRPSNLAVLDRAAHRAKTHGGWRVRQPEPGVFDWTSPLGYRYRVDHHGTHRLDDHQTARTG
nr:DUF222 domain-containing protein [Propionibacterium sp.]